MTYKEAGHHLDTYSSTLGSGITTQKQHDEAKRIGIEAIDRCIKIQKIIDSYDADFIANYVRGMFKEDGDIKE